MGFNDTPTLAEQLKLALVDRFGSQSSVEVSIDHNATHTYWSFRVDVRTEEFADLCQKDRLRAIAEIVNPIVQPFVDKNRIRNGAYLYFGLAPTDPPIPSIPLPG